MSRYYNCDPYEATAKYKSICGECGKEIQKGDHIYIWPSAARGKKARCGCGEGEYLQFLGSRQDENNYNSLY